MHSFVVETNVVSNLRFGGQLEYQNGRFSILFTRSKHADRRAAKAIATFLPSTNPLLLELATVFLHSQSKKSLSKDLMEIDRRLKGPFHLNTTNKFLNKFIKEPTCQGHTVIRDEKLATLAFTHHPEEVDFIKKHHIEKWVGTFDHEIVVDPDTYEMQVLCEGKLTSIKSLMAITHSSGDVLFKDGEKLFYVEEQGITRFDPEKQEAGIIPIFKLKKASNEYFLEINTVIDDTGTHNHAFMTLHDPSGKVHSFGYFRPYGHQVDWTELLHSMEGSLASPDRYEFMRLEKYRKRTVVPLTAYEHSEILRRVVGLEKVYNLINQNCISMMKRVLKEVVGIQLETRSSLMKAYLGINLNKYALLRYVPPFRLIAAGLVYGLSLFRNVVYIFLGAYKKHNGVSVFNRWYDVFNPKKGMPDHPKALREWQEKVEADGYLPRDRDEKDKDLWWYAKDLLWAQCDREGLVDMA